MIIVQLLCFFRSCAGFSTGWKDMDLRTPSQEPQEQEQEQEPVSSYITNISYSNLGSRRPEIRPRSVVDDAASQSGLVMPTPAATLRGGRWTGGICTVHAEVENECCCNHIGS